MTTLTQNDSSVNSTNTHKNMTRSLTIATAIMMGSVLLSRVAGLLREQVMAHFGGTGSDMDAYVTAFLIPELLNHFLAGGFLSVTFIPIFQKRLLNGDTKGAWRSFSNLMTIGTLFFIIFIPLAMIFTPNILGLMGHSKTPEQLKLTTQLTRIILPAQIFFYWGAFFSAVQYARQKFFLPALVPLVYNFGIIILGIILGPYIGIKGFCWGVLAGAFIGNILIQLPGALKAGLQYSFIIDFKDSDFITYIKKTLPLILGLSATFSNEIFFRIFAGLLPAGTTASVNYALRTTMIVVAIFGQASGVAFFPFLSELAVKKEFQKMTELLNTVLKKIALYLLPLSGIMIVLSQQIIAILFERGQFTHASTLQTSSIFAVYLTGTFAFSAAMIVSRSFYATQNTLLPMIVSTSTSLLSIPLYLFFGKLMGGTGIALAAVFGMSAQFIILYGMWYHKHMKIGSLLATVPKFLKVVLVCAAGCAVGYFIRKFSLGLHVKPGLLFNTIVCFLSGVPSLLTVFVLYEFTGIQKIRVSVKGLLRKK